MFLIKSNNIFYTEKKLRLPQQYDTVIFCPSIENSITINHSTVYDTEYDITKLS